MAIHPKLLHVPKHQRDNMVGAALSDSLRQQYKRRSARVIKGDSVKVMRGEYKGVEGKVDKVNTVEGTLEIEGIQREKVRGGQVKVPIHASKVMITGLKTDDKYRSAMLSGQKQQAEAKPKADKAAKKKAAVPKKKAAAAKKEKKEEKTS
ncbi:ribosomal protein L24p/L26e, archaeal/eukaryotic [Candidatus Nitrososphaera evergladensis SR1]|jgi:large subunit ribosomal protein L24|uniref:Large ribosomal subunit protein uL24 n=1 Tax=Candidatus Nitrososphaera evergladensis SR1 TaxID=1459636 RepID=A0A075MQR7_9ARCH|nr:50S ribosomal protein L24 [Candidatus Nitrososphaera evergladensis]AIF83886.1 ribosomal protein L24p/L26e, archaeal/eukaryotic [Candidatus Nitrososphaera evergladensis SR1]